MTTSDQNQNDACKTIKEELIKKINDWDFEGIQAKELVYFAKSRLMHTDLNYGEVKNLRDNFIHNFPTQRNPIIINAAEFFKLYEKKYIHFHYGLHGTNWELQLIATDSQFLNQVDFAVANQKVYSINNGSLQQIQTGATYYKDIKKSSVELFLFLLDSTNKATYTQYVTYDQQKVKDFLNGKTKNLYIYPTFIDENCTSSNVTAENFFRQNGGRMVLFFSLDADLDNNMNNDSMKNSKAGADIGHTNP